MRSGFTVPRDQQGLQVAASVLNQSSVGTRQPALLRE